MNLKIVDFIAFMNEKKKELLSDSKILQIMADFEIATGLTGMEAAVVAYDRLVQDAASSLKLIENVSIKDATILEIGGGVGLTYLWLKRLNFKIYSIEPSGEGHDQYYELGKILCTKLDINQETWLPLCAAEAGQINERFDLIFSNNVLEHISNLGESLSVLLGLLNNGGIMRHSCPNYLWPYDPHFGIPLIPFFPQATSSLIPNLKRNTLWKSLNFISSFKLEALIKKNHYRISYDNDILLETFQRLDSEPLFREKHFVLNLAWVFLKITKIHKLFTLIPAKLLTPIQFSIKKS